MLVAFHVVRSTCRSVLSVCLCIVSRVSREFLRRLIVARVSVYVYSRVLVPPPKKGEWRFYMYSIYICIRAGVFNGALFAETLYFEHVDLTLR